jgi:transposase
MPRIIRELTRAMARPAGRAEAERRQVQQGEATPFSALAGGSPRHCAANAESICEGVNRLDVHVLPSGEVFALPNNESGVPRLLTRLTRLAPALLVLEVTGGYEAAPAAGLVAGNLPVAVLDLRQIRDFARAIGPLAKTDQVDAAVTALLAERIRREPCPLPDAEARALAELVARCRQVLGLVGTETNRRHAARDPRVRAATGETSAVLRFQLAKFDAEIDAMVRASPVWREAEDLLTSAPGIGGVIARAPIAELPEVGTFDRRRLAALVGVAPVNQDSDLQARARLRL